MLSFEDIREKVRAAVDRKFPETGEPGSYAYIRATTEQDVVIERGGKLWRLSYSIDDNHDVTLGEPELVEVEYETVGESVGFSRSLDRTGAVWDVRILRFGRSGNGWLWTRESGEALLPHLTNAPVGCYVYKRALEAHAEPEAVAAAGGPLVRNIVGDVQKPRIEADGVYGEVHIHEDSEWLRKKLLALERRGVLDKMIGLSVDTLAGYVPVQVREGAAKWIKAVKRVIGLDVVTAPSADGRFIRATAGPLLITEEDGMRERLIALIKEHRPKLLEGRVVEQLTEAQLEGLVREALAAPGAPGTPAPASAAAATTNVNVNVEAIEARISERLETRFKIQDTQGAVAAKLADSKLPEIAQARVRKRFEGRVAEAAEIDAVIGEERDYLAKLSPSGDVRGFGGVREGVEVLAEPRDKVQAAIDRVFGVTPEAFESALKKLPISAERMAVVRESLMPSHEAHKHRGFDVRGSLKAIYVAISGDHEISGEIRTTRVTEAQLAADWPNILGNTLYRRFLMEFAEPVYNERSIAMFGSAADFRTKEVLVLDYPGDLPEFDPEQVDYPEAPTLTDDKVQYAVSTRGQMVTISRRTIINDDVNAVVKKIARYGRAARRTLARFIWSMWINNVVYDVDGVAWFHASHGNTGSVALTANLTGANEVLAKIIQLADAAEPGSAEKLGLPPMDSLWLDVPHALYGVAVQINQSQEFGAGNVNPVRHHFGVANERINVNPLFTDATDWGVHLSPGAGGRESIQVDFLQGREEPEVFLADQPTVGRMFHGDRLQWKFRHEYGGDVVDFRGATKNVVAG